MTEISNEYQAYLDQKQSRWNTPEAQLRELVRRSCGCDWTRLERVIKGGENEVYMMTTERGEDLVVRILREERDGVPGGAAEEVWCLNSCREIGLPVPTVVALDTVEDDQEELGALVLARLAGTPFSERMAEMSPRQIEIGFCRMGEALGKLHSIKVGGYYRRDPDDGCWDYPTWEAASQDFIKCRSAEIPQLREAGFSESEVDLVLRCLHQCAEDLGETEPSLCHGDLGPGHVFLGDSVELTGVIDFGQYSGDHPVSDFAALRMDLSADRLDLVGEGYGQAYNDDFLHCLRLARVPKLVGYLAHHIKIPDHPETPSYVSGLRDALNELRVGSDC